VTGAQMQERRFVDAHGVEVVSNWWPVADPRGIVLIAHGASEHSARYDRFARALNDAGLAAVAIDHRGHGGTQPGAGPALMGPGGGRAVVDDLAQLQMEAVTELGEVPVVLLGHSLGSLIALAYLTEHSAGLAGCILSAVPADVDGAAELEPVLRSVAEAGMRDEPMTDLFSAHNTRFEPARTAYDWLSRDEAEVDRYLADPLCGDDRPLSYGYLLEVIEVVAPARERFADISCPVLVVVGDEDPAAAMGEHAEKAAAALVDAGVAAELIVYEGARHELLNEINRDDVTEDLVAWIAARV
jgi:alpha-beta hydrolase superfamily lysophospholipase